LEQGELTLSGETIEILTNEDQTLSFTHPQNLERLRESFDLDSHRIEPTTLRTIFQEGRLDDHAIGVTEAEAGIVGIQLELLHDAIEFATDIDETDAEILLFTPDGNVPIAIGVKPASQTIVDCFAERMSSSVTTESGVVIVIPPYSIAEGAVRGMKNFDGIRVLEVEPNETAESGKQSPSTESSTNDLPTLSISKIFGYIGGGVSLLSAMSIAYQMGWQSTSPVTWGDASVVFFLFGAGAISAPNTRPQVEQIIGYKLSQGMVVVLVLLLWFLAGVMLL
jgi:hypothetical protein